MESGIAENGY